MGAKGDVDTSVTSLKAVRGKRQGLCSCRSKSIAKDVSCLICHSYCQNWAEKGRVNSVLSVLQLFNFIGWTPPEGQEQGSIDEAVHIGRPPRVQSRAEGYAGYLSPASPGLLSILLYSVVSLESNIYMDFINRHPCSLASDWSTTTGLPVRKLEGRKGKWFILCFLPVLSPRAGGSLDHGSQLSKWPCEFLLLGLGNHTFHLHIRASRIRICSWS